MISLGRDIFAATCLEGARAVLACRRRDDEWPYDFWPMPRPYGEYDYFDALPPAAKFAPMARRRPTPSARTI